MYAYFRVGFFSSHFGFFVRYVQRYDIRFYVCVCAVSFFFFTFYVNVESKFLFNWRRRLYKLYDGVFFFSWNETSVRVCVLFFIYIKVKSSVSNKVREVHKGFGGSLKF